MRDDYFYVGYLPEAPRSIGRFVRAVVGVILLGGLGLAGLMTASQQPFGKGIFEFGTTRTFEGWIELEPYPLLVVERPGGGVSTYLMSAFGKFGADAEVAPFDGRHVRLEGTLVHRGGQTMVEVAAGSVQAIAGDAARPDLERIAGDERSRSFVGEIVDSKCYLGVMKPGATKPHRACATRCISGGVPPVLLVRDEEGRATYLLLVDADGGAVGREVVDRGLVAEPVRVSGVVDRIGERLLLRADPATIERLE